MKQFTRVQSIVTPLNKVNVDTDQIVPKQFLKLVQKTGFGKFLFYDWRFDDNKPISDFILNDKKYENSNILVAGDNFGCGSSREHAVWALLDYGFSVIIAPSFADIFYSNCFKNGLLPIKLETKIVQNLMQEKSKIEVDLQTQTITTNSGKIPFEIDAYKKNILLKGLDDIAITLQLEGKITNFEKKSTVPSVL